MYLALVRALYIFFLSAGMRNELQADSFYQCHLKVNAQSQEVRENSFLHFTVLPPLWPACDKYYELAAGVAISPV